MSENRRRDRSIRFRVTDEEREEIIEAAERVGLSRSGWIRDRLLRLARKERVREEQRRT